MTSVTLTNRELKNKATGVDILVPQYEHIPGPFGGSVDYHIIVVTQLFYFKTPTKHKESDIVQFMIPQKYEVFEELCNKLTQKFPSVVFDTPPKKPFLINDAVISDRRQYMQDVLQQIARTPKLACSSLVLEFLGAKRGHKEVNRFEDTHGISDKDEDTATGKKNTQEEITDDVDLFASAEGKDDQTEDREEEDLFAAAKSSGPLSNLRVKGFSIFSTDDKDDANDEDINSLFVPAGAEEGNTVSVDAEDNSELLKIEDDLDKLLTVKAKPQKPPKPSLPVAKPRLKPKPNLKPKPTPKPRFVEAAAGENELFGSEDAEAADQKTKETSAAKGKPGSKDLFDQARKHSFRSSSHGEETLDDIFKTKSRAVFETEDDDDLFKTASTAEKRNVEEMSVDDIANYIQQNEADSNAKLDLF